VELDDVLRLRRRSSGGASAPGKGDAKTFSCLSTQRETKMDLGSVVSPDDQSFSTSAGARSLTRRRRLPIRSKPKAVSPRSLSPVDSDLSEDNHTFASSLDKPYVALDLTRPERTQTDDDILAGCSALLELASKGWN
jgi:hypothetical protein